MSLAVALRRDDGLQPRGLCPDPGPGGAPSRAVLEMEVDAPSGPTAGQTERRQLRVRGRYDAVLNDQEPIFEPIEPDDFVQPSDPTEVFIPTPELSLSLPFTLPEKPADPVDPVDLARSQTASPFLLPTKPYRPFSTEPIVEVPPLEDPIILNANYHDEFGNPNEDFLPKTKFKLPISEQYDPDFGKEKKGKQCQATDGVANQKCEVMTQEEMVFLKQMKTDIDLVKMEETSTTIKGFGQSIPKDYIEEAATLILIKDEDTRKEETVQEKAMTVVDESIVKALSVAEEIKKETQIELKSSKVSANAKKTVVEDKEKKLEDLIFKESNFESIYKETIKEEMKSKEKSNETAISEDTKTVSIKEEIQETIAAGTVKRLSSTFDKEIEVKDLEYKKIDEAQEKSREYKTGKQIQKESVTSKKSVTSDKNAKKTEVISEKQKMTTGKLLAEQRAYTIGLQTIPNIRGSVHSSYHYDLLLKTFFIHLTDVMVALSRFILAEPVISKNEGITSDVSMQDTITKEVKCTQKQDTKEEMTINETFAAKSNFVENVKDNKNISEEIVETDRLTKYEEEIGEKKKSGAEMAQRTAKTSKELIQGMGAVINEFQSKTGIEDMTTQTTEVHKRSHSTIEDEVSKESDPLEWLSKTEVQTTSKELSEVKQTTEISKTEQSMMDTSNLEVRKGRDRSRSKSREGRTIYVATVESHVYTNKEEILENQFSDTSSEEATEINNGIAIENVTLETFQNNEIVSEEVQEAAKFIAEKIEKKQISETTESAISKLKTLEQIIDVKETKIEKELQTTDKTHEIKATEARTESERTESIVEKTEIVKSKLSTESAVANIEISQVQETLPIHQIKIKEEENQVVVLRKPSDIKAEESIAVVQVLKEVSPLLVQETLTSESQSSETVIAEATFETKSNFELNKSEETGVYETISEEKTFQETLQNQRTTFTALSSTEMQKQRESLRKLSLKCDKSLAHSDSFSSTISTPTPASVPPTPLTDEYVFRLECQMKHLFPSNPEHEEPSPEKEIDHEDPYTTKKKLIPHIETKIERIVYDPPLATTPSDVEVKDVPTFKPLNGELKQTVGEEELQEIERKSSLLASVIDETIKSIEEYNEQISMDSKKVKIKEEFISNSALKEETSSEQMAVESKIKTEIETKPMYASFVKEAKTTVFADAMPVIAKEIDKCEENIKIAQNAQVDYLSSVLSTDVAQVSSMATKDSASTAEAEKDVISSKYSASAKSEISVTDQVSEQVSEQARESNQVTFKVADLKALTQQVTAAETKSDALQGFRSVAFNPDEIRTDIEPPPALGPVQVSLQGETEIARPRGVAVDGATPPPGTTQGFVDALPDPVLDLLLDKQVGRAGLTAQQVADLVCGQSEMLRDAHVMGLSRVLASHMSRPGDAGDAELDKMKPTIESLRDSAVLRALNEELAESRGDKRGDKQRDKRTWTTFLQRPQRQAPSAKFGYHGWLPQFVPPQEQYKVKIVKQPKPKVAPDYKPEQFETGPLPWEERASREPPPPPPRPEEPILVPEARPELLQARDPLPESEVPDLEDSGIPLPPEKTEEEQPLPEAVKEKISQEEIEKDQKETEEAAEEGGEEKEEMEQNRVLRTDQLLADVQAMVDTAAPLEQQLAQLRAQLAQLAQLPAAIQQSLELVTNQLLNMSHQETKAVTETTETMEISEVTEVTETKQESIEESSQQESTSHEAGVEQVVEQKEAAAQPTVEEIARMREEEALMLQERDRLEKQKKEMMQQQLEHESRLVREHATPRAARPRPAFGPLAPAERPLVLPGGRRWRKPKDAYNDAFIAETLAAQAEIIQGKAKGFSYESNILPYDQRINFMKYEKPPVSLEHLKESEVYKLVHCGEPASALRGVDLLTPVVAECDYREKCRSVTPSVGARPLDLSQQHQP